MSRLEDILEAHAFDRRHDETSTRGCEAARLELAQLRRAVEALRKLIDAHGDRDCEAFWHVKAECRAILAEIDGKEPTDGK